MTAQGRTCNECGRRWREFAAATNAHVELLKELDRLGPEDRGRLRAIEGEIESAAARRDAARIAVRTHLAVDHLEQMQAAGR
jgi:hypothetical protein